MATKKERSEIKKKTMKLMSLEGIDYDEWLHTQHIKFVDEQGEKILDRLMDEKLQQANKNVVQPTPHVHGGEEK
ncbi:hypothetical protein ACK4CS_12670 [Enterococcus gallinarum]|uniref:Uncharacterized protein n=1 Tax=Enterococcus gallinarum TaxID=1353 RepID=A0AAE4KSZ9_ENTGA|nr:hypothetical protein [Enterococcus gallinarum]MDT2691523.1 hypothetical protein [Enterococcus gallinarum]